MAQPTRQLPPRVSSTARTLPPRVAPQMRQTPAEIAMTGRKVSALTATENEPVILDPRENILLCADSVAGKTYAYYREADREYRLALDEGRTPARYWIIDTDLSHPKFLAPGYEFAHLAFNVGGNCYPLVARNIAQTRGAVKTILERGDPTRDWAVVDVVNYAYEQAQRQHAIVTGKDLDDEWAARQTAGKGFGAFEPGDWNTVRRAFEAAIYRLFDHWAGNVLFCAHIKPIILHFDGKVAKTTRREMMTLFGPTGFKPEGAPNLIKAVDSIVMAWAVRDPDPVTGQLTAVRKFRVLKDRGQMEASSELIYDRDLFQSFYDWRQSGNFVENITDPTAAAEIEGRVEAEMNAHYAANAAAAEDEQPGDQLDTTTGELTPTIITNTEDQ